MEDRRMMVCRAGLLNRSGASRWEFESPVFRTMEGFQRRGCRRIRDYAATPSRACRASGLWVRPPPPPIIFKESVRLVEETVSKTAAAKAVRGSWPRLSAMFNGAVG